MKSYDKDVQQWINYRLQCERVLLRICVGYMSCRQLSLRKIGCQHFANAFCTDNVTQLFTKDREKLNQIQTYKEQVKETKFGSEGKEKEDSIETLASTSLDGVQFISAEEYVTAIRQLKLVELALGKDARVETMHNSQQWDGEGMDGRTLCVLLRVLREKSCSNAFEEAQIL
ncbi:MAG: hypothetical protein EZS28_046355, partial [Streblomastix strix]